MIIYMLLNLATEQVYVGRTTSTLKARIAGHWEYAYKGGTTLLSEAIRDYPDKTTWEFIVLQHCYDEAQLLDAEAAWIRMCSARCSGVGYNSKQESMTGAPVSKRRNDTIPKPREYYVEAGKKGAERSKALGKSKTKKEMTEGEREKFREWGRKGAKASKEKALRSDLPSHPTRRSPSISVDLWGLLLSRGIHLVDLRAKVQS